MDDVGVSIRGYRIHALNVLEAKIISDEPPLPQWFHGFGGILNFRHRILLRVQDRARGSYPHSWHIRCTDSLCMPN